MFVPASAIEVSKIIAEFPNTSCDVDPLPIIDRPVVAEPVVFETSHHNSAVQEILVSAVLLEPYACPQNQKLSRNPQMPC